MLVTTTMGASWQGNVNVHMLILILTVIYDEDPVWLFFFFFSFLFGWTGVWTQDFAKQMLYRLSHTFNPFCSSYFGEGISWTICLGRSQTSILLISASQIAKGYRCEPPGPSPTWNISDKCTRTDLCQNKVALINKLSNLLSILIFLANVLAYQKLKTGSCKKKGF
jgi:hypothetical protein